MAEHADRGGWRLVAAGAVLGALAVGAGAFGAHALRDHFAAHEPKLEAWWDTAVLYHLTHAVAAALAGLVAVHRGRGHRAGWFFIAGVAIFSGTLYAMALGGPRWLGAVTPLGGAALILGWLGLAVASWRESPRALKG